MLTKQRDKIMLRVLDTFSPAKFLPVQISEDSLEIIEMEFCKKNNNGSIYLEIGDSIEECPTAMIEFFEENSDGLLEEAIENECEYIKFFV